jgi:long-chain fatty acid transport protein
MRQEKFWIIVMTLCSFLFVQDIFATDGYFSVGYGARSRGMGGVGVAYAPASLINGNPAALVQIGKSFEIGLNAFMPSREYTITGNPSGMPGTFGLTPGTVESESNFFPVPYLGANWAIGNNQAFGFTIYGNGGMNTDYPTRTFYDQSSETTGVNLAQLFMNVNYAYEFAEKHSIGVSAIVGYQYFEALGLASFGPFSSASGSLTDNGVDNNFGIGFKLGYLGEIASGFTFGVNYQSRVQMGPFEDYAGLFAEQGDFDVPAALTVGLAYDLSEDFTILFDVRHIWYSTINAVANPFDSQALPPAFLNPGGDPNNPMDYTPNPNHVPLGDDAGSGFGWEDMTAFKIGAEYRGIEGLMLRGGYSYGSQPIPETEVLFNILAPGVVEHHIALGLSKEIGAKGNQLHFAVSYALSNTVTGYNPMDFDPAQLPNMVPNQTIDLELSELEIEVGFSF